GLVDPRRGHLGPLADLGIFLTGGQADPGISEPSHALVAAGTTEDEVDRGKHPLLGQDLHDLFAARHVHASMAFAGARDPPLLPATAPSSLVRTNPELLLV